MTPVWRLHNPTVNALIIELRTLEQPAGNQRGLEIVLA